MNRGRPALPRTHLLLEAMTVERNDHKYVTNPEGDQSWRRTERIFVIRHDTMILGKARTSGR
jgi:hypothetical protein